MQEVTLPLHCDLDGCCRTGVRGGAVARIALRIGQDVCCIDGTRAACDQNKHFEMPIKLKTATADGTEAIYRSPALLHY
jgi:hypothetical protein